MTARTEPDGVRELADPRYLSLIQLRKANSGPVMKSTCFASL